MTARSAPAAASAALPFTRRAAESRSAAQPGQKVVVESDTKKMLRIVGFGLPHPGGAVSGRLPDHAVRWRASVDCAVYRGCCRRSRTGCFAGRVAMIAGSGPGRAILYHRAVCSDTMFGYVRPPGAMRCRRRRLERFRRMYCGLMPYPRPAVWHGSPVYPEL